MMSDVTTGEVYGSLYLYFVFINCTSSDRPSWLVWTAVGIIFYNNGIAPPFIAWDENAMPHCCTLVLPAIITLHRRWFCSLCRPGLNSQPSRFACSPRWSIVKLVSKPPLAHWATGSLDWSDITAPRVCSPEAWVSGFTRQSRIKLWVLCAPATSCRPSSSIRF